MSKLKNKRILVTGGGGFIPSHLTHRLFELGAEVAITTKYNSIFDNIRIANIFDNIHIIEVDLRNQDSLKQIKDFRPQIIFHCAAYNHVGDSFLQVSETLNSNALGTAFLIEAYQNFEKFIYISTSEVYGFQQDFPFTETMTPHPISPYAIGKYSGELYCQMQMYQMKKPIVIIRPFNAFGPFQSPRAIIGEMIINCLINKPIYSTEGKQTRDFNFVSNLIDGFIAAAEKDEAIGEIINIGSGIEITIRDLIYLIHKETGSSSELKIGQIPYRPTEIWRMAADNQKAQRILGWSPQVNLLTGIKKSIAWYREFLSNFKDPQSALYKLCRSACEN